MCTYLPSGLGWCSHTSFGVYTRDILMMMLCFMVFTCLKWTPFSKIAMLGSFFYPTFIFLLEQFKYFVLEKRQDIWSLVSF